MLRVARPKPDNHTIKASFKALFLDFDGVLVDSEPIWWDIIDDVARAQKLVASEGHVERRSGIRVRDTIATLVQNNDPLVESMTKEVFAVGEARLASTPLAKGAIEAIQQFWNAGVVLGLVSSSNSAFLEHMLQTNAVLQYFSVLVGGDHVERGKPAPDGYLLAASEVGVTPRLCCAVEDSSPGILAAAAAEMYVVHFGKLRVNDPDVVHHIDASTDSFAGLQSILFNH